MVQPLYHLAANALVLLPVDYAGPDALAGRHNAFVCGSLQNPEKMFALLGRETPFAPAYVRGFRWESLDIDGRAAQLMLPAPDNPGAILPGIVWLDLNDDDGRAIGAFELAGGLRREIEIAVQVGRLQISATTFVKK